jgi:F0F1-type ATP synthase membrane subunit c/vacuolar-type H+-ATPase subunit K
MGRAIIALVIVIGTGIVCWNALPEMARKSWGSCIGAMLILLALLTVLFFLALWVLANKNL